MISTESTRTQRIYTKLCGHINGYTNKSAILALLLRYLHMKMCFHTNVPTSELDLMAPIDITKETKTEAVFPRGVGEAIDGEARRSTVEGVANTRVCLVVIHRAPVVRLLVGHRGVRRVIDCYIVQSV